MSPKLSTAGHLS